MPGFARLLILLTLGSALLSGCGDSGNEVPVVGKLTKGGMSYRPPAGHDLSITLVALEARDAAGKSIQNEPYLANIDEDGQTFRVPGRDGRGVPPGKYRVALMEKMTREAFNTAPPASRLGRKVDRETDYLDGKFGVERSPIVREVDGSKPLIIDLDKPTEG